MGLSYTHFDSLGDFLHTNYEKTNFHEFITISILIKYTEIESDAESNTNKLGYTLLWFLQEKVPVTSCDLKAKLASFVQTFERTKLKAKIYSKQAWL